MDRLLNRLMDGEEFASISKEEPDPEVLEAARRLWANDQEASCQNFLESPIPLISNLDRQAMPAFSDGQVLIGRFKIEGLLGAGGMGEVYLAFDQRVQQRVAIKTIRRELAFLPEVCERFLAEVQSARCVTHPNVCRINEIFDENATPFLSMEFVDGCDLAEWLSRTRPPQEVTRSVALQLAEGLYAAHRSGVVHGDFKPSNVLVTGTPNAPRVVITDFGLARAALFQQHVAAGKGSGVVPAAGTRLYMAPELLKGGDPNIASDIYAYGRVLAQLLPGHRLVNACASANPEARPAGLEQVVRALKGGIPRRLWLPLIAAGMAELGAAYYFMRSHPKLVLSRRQRIAVNGFHSKDMALAFGVRDLFVTALRQSPLLMVLADERIRSLLGSIQAPKALPTDIGNLLAIAARESALAIDGELIRTADRLRLVLRLFVSGTDKDHPAITVVQEATDSSSRVQMVEQATAQMRREFGESARSLPRDGYLQRLTSNSTLALDYYYEALDEMQSPNPANVVLLLMKAVEQDPNFAMAQIQLGVGLATADRLVEGFPHYQRAFDLRNAVSERERLYIEGRYYNIICDFHSSFEVCKQLAFLYPDEARFQMNAAFAATRSGNSAEALPYSRRAMELNTDNENYRSEWLVNNCDNNLYDVALQEYQRFRNEGRTSTLLDWGAGVAHTGRAEFDEARAAFERMIAGSDSNDDRVRWGHLLVCIPLIASGRWNHALFQLAGDLAYDTAINEQLYQPTRRYWLGKMYVLTDSPGLAYPHAAALCNLEASGIWLQSLEEGALLALEIGDEALASRALESLRQVERKWPSTHSHGARALIEGLLMRPDLDSGQMRLNAAAGLWSDPITLYEVGRFQNARRDFEGAVRTLTLLEEARGRAYRLFFPGLVVLGRIERARALSAMSLFPDAFRLYRQIMTECVDRIPSCSLKAQLLSEYESLQKRKD